MEFQVLPSLAEFEQMQCAWAQLSHWLPLTFRFFNGWDYIHDALLILLTFCCINDRVDPGWVGHSPGMYCRRVRRCALNRAHSILLSPPQYMTVLVTQLDETTLWRAPERNGNVVVFSLHFTSTDLVSGYHSVTFKKLMKRCFLKVKHCFHSVDI